MKKNILSILGILAIAILILISCQKEQNIEPKDISNIECNDSIVKYVGSEILGSNPLPEKELNHLMSNFKSTKSKLQPEFSKSVQVTYKGLAAKAIFTPMISSKSNEQTYLLSYIEDTLFSDDYLMLKQVFVNESNIVYSFLTINQELICSFNVNSEGFLTDFQFGETYGKSMPTTWSGCVKQAVVAISEEPVVALVCMWFSPQCAGFLGFMCLGVYQQ